MIRKLQCLIIIFICWLTNVAQNNTYSIIPHQQYFPCASTPPSQQWEDHFQQLITNYQSNQHQQKNSTIYTIPVIFHVIHGGEPVGTFPNITQAQINAQISVLNADFSGNGLNAGNYPANAFVNWAINQTLPAANIDANGRVKIANTEIQFCLATKDTLGNLLAEPGIERIDYNSKGWSNPNTFTLTTTLKPYLDGTIKPQSIWNVRKYLNIWLTDRSSLLPQAGVSSVPPLSGLLDIPNNATNTTDGIWCYAKVIGSYLLYPSGTYAGPIVQGRTLTHEVGHYFGLRHIWGDGNCATDYCNDTPPAFSENTANPTYPNDAGSCNSPSNSPDGEMFMNFMDYTSDPNKYMFTTDQLTRMKTALLNSPYRKELGTHELCSVPTLLGEEENNFSNIIYPNPVTDQITISIGDQQLKSVKLFDHTGCLLKEYLTPVFSIAELPCGQYFILIQTNKAVETKKIVKH